LGDPVRFIGQLESTKILRLKAIPEGASQAQYFLLFFASVPSVFQRVSLQLVALQATFSAGCHPNLFW
jgi:hypothetical protein